MTVARTLTTGLLVSALAAGMAFAQPARNATPPVTTYEPRSGQAGKDVVWVPTQQALVDRMLEMGGATTQDYVIDLGSGDGRTVITAAKRGIRAMGVEYNPELVALSKRNAEAEGVGDKAKFVQGDIFETDFSEATVLTLFLLPQLNLRLRPTILDMKPGTRVVSNTFTMDDWTPDQTIDAGGDCVNFCRAHKWIVPAKVGGDWKLGEGALKLTQNFQMLSGTLTIAGKESVIGDARMNGAEIAFTADGKRYTGRVDGNRIEGAAANGQPAWTATRG